MKVFKKRKKKKKKSAFLGNQIATKVEAIHESCFYTITMRSQYFFFFQLLSNSDCYRLLPFFFKHKKCHWLKSDRKS